MIRLLPAATACTLVLASLSAQDDVPPPVRSDAGSTEVGNIDEQSGPGDEAEFQRMEGAGVEPAGPAPTPGGLERYVSPIVAFRPGRIPPGGTGVAHIVLAMSRSAVMLPEGNPEIAYETVQGPVTLGSHSIDPPKPATLSRRYRGQPVWDNTLTVTLPVSVAPDAEHGRYQVHFDIEAGVMNDETGGEFGRFRMVANGQLEVGPALPVAVAPQSRTSGSERVAAAVSEVRGDPEPHAASEGLPVEREAYVAEPAARASGDPGTNLEPISGGLPPPGGDSEVPVVLLAAAGVVVLGVIALVAAKR